MVGIIGVKKLIGYLLNLIFLLGWGGFYLIHITTFYDWMKGINISGPTGINPIYLLTFDGIICVIYTYFFLKLWRRQFKSKDIRKKLQNVGSSCILAIIWMILEIVWLILCDAYF